MRVAPLSEKHLVELKQAVDRALAQWLTGGAPEAPVDVVRALERVLLFLKQNGDASAQARHVASLAFAFGEQLVRHGGWTWHSVSEDGGVNPTVVRADGRACLVVDTMTALVTKSAAIGLVDLFTQLVEAGPQPSVHGVVSVDAGAASPDSSRAARERFERDVVARLEHVRKALRMWGSPEELEAVAEHFTHVLLAARSPGWTFEQTHALWVSHGGPFAGDADEHAVMRSRMWAEHLETARQQVTFGYASVWAALRREPDREHFTGEWIETVLDTPRLAGTPDRLNAVLFALIGFVATDPQAYVAHLSAERDRTGGHALRPFHVVAPPGPTEAALPYGRSFVTWEAVSSGIGRVLAGLASGASGPRST
ncbi:MAG: hypothetical protein SFW67_29980 [Myxococcaceae bacterium]|nr:hypothetical protein [Myxococcaceae bacterium]